jgi:hypothetical protein
VLLNRQAMLTRDHQLSKSLTRYSLGWFSSSMMRVGCWSRTPTARWAWSALQALPWLCDYELLSRPIRGRDRSSSRTLRMSRCEAC